MGSARISIWLHRLQRFLSNSLKGWAAQANPAAAVVAEPEFPTTVSMQAMAAATGIKFQVWRQAVQKGYIKTHDNQLVVDDVVAYLWMLASRRRQQATQWSRRVGYETDHAAALEQMAKQISERFPA